MTSVILIQPPYEDFYATPLRTYPLGLLYIAGALERAGISVSVLNAAEGGKRQIPLPSRFSYLKEIYKPDRSPFSLFDGYYRYGLDVERILEFIRENSPSLIGISVLTSAYSSHAFELAGQIRRKYPDIPLVCGGHHATQFPEDCTPVFDYVIRGEGEHAIVSVAQDVLKGDKPDAVLCPSFPDPDLIPLRSAVAVPEQKGEKFTQILTSRGCPYRCSYCCTGSGNTGRFRMREVDDIVSEFRSCIDEFGITHFDIEDENFTFDRKRTEKLLLDLIELFDGRRIRLSAMNGLLPETLDPELISLMYKAGFRELDLSIGSFCEKILTDYNRPVSLLESFRSIYPAALEFGMNMTVYTISGGPHNTLDSAAEDLFQSTLFPVKIGLSNYYPAPGSPDYEEALFDIPDDFSSYRSSAFPVEAGLSRLEMSTASRISRLLNFAKELRGRGLGSLARVEPAGTGDTVEPGNEVVLLKTFFSEKKICGLEPADRTVYLHEVSPELIELVLDKISKTDTIQALNGEFRI